MIGVLPGLEGYWTLVYTEEYKECSIWVYTPIDRSCFTSVIMKSALVNEWKSERLWLKQNTLSYLKNTSPSLTTTLTRSRKSIDLFERGALVENQARAIMHDMPTQNIYRAERLTIGELVWIWAFSKNRRGIVTGNRGSRVIVSYVTPASPHIVKNRILPVDKVKVERATP